MLLLTFLFTMIINKERDNIQVLGEVKQIKTSIDPKNLEFITTLLSSNLYSKPEQSFIREIVSNAWDSHVEAGTTDTPVIIRFSHEDNWYYDITIRDFGTGLSQEKFEDLYCNIGSSTKRDSNAFIGGFGIGRYASLACKNTVYINSYYNGIVYKYVIVKSGNTITTNLVVQQPTDEKNGLEVTIKKISSSFITSFRDALDYIVFFPNVYVDGINTAFNNVKIKKFNHFAVSSSNCDDKILLGNVLYPCNTTQLKNKEAKDFLDRIDYSGIVLKFNIGDLTVTPNRENIIYNNETIQIIEDKCKQAQAELDALVSPKLYKDYKDLYEYFRVLTTLLHYDPLNNTFCDKYSSRGYRVPVDVDKLTINGYKLDNEELSFLRIFFSMRVPNFKGVFTRGMFYTGDKLPYKVSSCVSMEAPNILMLKGISKMSAAVKEWIRNKYSNYVIVLESSEEFFKNSVTSRIKDLQYCPNKDLLLKLMYEYFTSKVTVIDVNHDSDFLAYKEALKKQKVSAPTIKKFLLHIQQPNSYSTSIEFSCLEDCIQYFKKRKRGCILLTMQDPIGWSDIANARGYTMIRARKDIYDVLLKVKPSWLVAKDYLLYKDPVIVKLHTIIHNFNAESRKEGIFMPSVYEATPMLTSLPDNLKSAFRDIIATYGKYKNHTHYMGAACNNNIRIDPYTDSMCKKLASYYTQYTKLTKSLDLDTTSQQDRILMAAVLTKTKVYRVNNKMYNDIKNNKLIKILCRK